MRRETDSFQGKITHDGQEFSLNQHFQQSAFALSDELDLDELEASRCLLDSEEDLAVLGRSLIECGIIRFHQQRKYALDSLRLLLEMDSDDNDDDDLEDGPPLEAVQIFVSERLYNKNAGQGARGGRLVPQCMSTMQSIKSWLQNLGDKITAAQTINQNGGGAVSEEAETVEFSRVSLIQQHETLAVILCKSVEKRQADESDFTEFMTALRRVDKYSNLLGS